jgi:hypothetical protein
MVSIHAQQIGDRATTARGLAGRVFAQLLTNASYVAARR